jgi:hypothetical protein
MKVLAMMVFVVVMMVACDESKDVTSGEIYCDALLNCDETNSDKTMTFDECVNVYDSNPCVTGEEDSCYRVFADSEKDCLMKFSQCEFWTNYESCLEQS